MCVHVSLLSFVCQLCPRAPEPSHSIHGGAFLSPAGPLRCLNLGISLRKWPIVPSCACNVCARVCCVPAYFGIWGQLAHIRQSDVVHIMSCSMNVFTIGYYVLAVGCWRFIARDLQHDFSRKSVSTCWDKCIYVAYRRFFQLRDPGGGGGLPAEWGGGRAELVNPPPK